MFSGSPFAGLPIADSGGFLYSAGVADLASVAESIDGVKQQGGVVTGNLSLSDTYSPTGVYNISAFDTATVTDAAYPLATFGASVSERARAVSVRQIGGGFSTGAMSSGPFSALGDFTREVPSDEVFGNVYSQNSVTNAAVGSDAIRTNAVNNISFTDSAFTLDSTRSNTVLPSLILGGGLVNDFMRSIPEYSVAVNELTTVVDAITTVIEYKQIVQETAFGSDSDLALVELFTTTVDSSQASELCSMTLIISSAVNDLVSSTDRLSTNIIVQSQCIELSHAVDELVARRYWENINTAESAGWRLVQNNIGID